MNIEEIPGYENCHKKGLVEYYVKKGIEITKIWANRNQDSQIIFSGWSPVAILYAYFDSETDTIVGLKAKIRKPHNRKLSQIWNWTSFEEKDLEILITEADKD